ncbi:MAG: molecular chaperone DnaJ [Rhodospirillaceae bacterium]|nr:MAG: molecular chaperone DnaJ [Rhodospirillaceae bacterium]
MTETFTKSPKKHSYTVPCSSSFRDQALALAQLKHCNVADLARSVVLVVPLKVIDDFADPGGPARDDRETVVLKSGKAEGKPWQRKPRLQVRMATGFAVETIRKALALALAIELGKLSIGVKSEQDRQNEEKRLHEHNDLLRDADLSLRKNHDEQERLSSVVKSLYFEPLVDGVQTYEQALYVMGFEPDSDPDARDVKARFRRLATVYHPDGKHGCHQRMSQLNAARELLL